MGYDTFTLAFIHPPSITTYARPCISLSALYVLFVSVLCYRFVLIQLILCCPSRITRLSPLKSPTHQRSHSSPKHPDGFLAQPTSGRLYTSGSSCSLIF